MSTVVISEKHCKGCELCVAFCPKGALAMSRTLSARGAHAAERVEGSACTGCLSCVLVCPDAAIEISKTTSRK